MHTIQQCRLNIVANDDALDPPMMPFNGVRSSCDTTDMNSSFASTAFVKSATILILHSPYAYYLKWLHTDNTAAIDQQLIYLA